MWTRGGFIICVLALYLSFCSSTRLHAKMNHSTSLNSFVPFFNLNHKHHSYNKRSNVSYILNSLESDHTISQAQPKNNNHALGSDSLYFSKSCLCGRRHFIGASGAVLIPTSRSLASDLPSDPKDMLNRIHPRRPDWYEEFYALVMEKGMKPYEAEIAGYKDNLFTKLRGKSKVLELGIGTGPNLKYYASDADVFVFGIDPNKNMEKYAQASAAAAGLPLTHFTFSQAVGEALPVSDASMDAVIGTLVLCSVNDVKLALQEVKRVLKPGGIYIFVEHVAAKDGTALRFMQNAFDPLQQRLFDGCHLTRETGKYISQAGFSDIDINMTLVGSLIGPQVYDPHIIQVRSCRMTKHQGGG